MLSLIIYSQTICRDFICYMVQLQQYLRFCARTYLKSEWVVSGDSSSHTFSSVGIQETDKWQFCSTTQVPALMALSNIFMAMGP